MKTPFFKITKNASSEGSEERFQFVLMQDDNAVMTVDSISPTYAKESTGMITQGMVIFAGLKLLAESINDIKSAVLKSPNTPHGET